MCNIYAIGEIVYDIIFRNSKPVQANPGGSMLNSAISLSRTGLPVFFIGETGSDEVGSIVNLFLTQNKVKTDYIQAYTNKKSSIALAFLDDKNDASYVFHKDYPKQRLTLELPTTKEGDIVLFGSSFALNTDVRNTLHEFIHHAKKNGATIIYDPNFRKQTSEKEELVKLVKENISLADIVRGSDEDFQNIFGISDDSLLYKLVEDNGCNHLIITKNAYSVKIQTPSFKKQIKVPKINTISTIGAGDNFNAGIIYGLQKQTIRRSDLAIMSPKQWDIIIETGIAFASHVCESLDNYISTEFAENFATEK